MQEPELLALIRAAPSGGMTPELRGHLDAAFRHHEARLLRICIRFVGDEQRAQELLQDTFATAIRRVGTFEGQSPLFGWLYGIARNLCLRAIAKKRDLLADDGLLEAADGGSGVLTALQRHERLALLREVAAEVLDELEQEAVHLRYVEGVGQRDVGRILGVDARVVLQRSRRKLQRALRLRAAAMGHGSSLFHS